MSCLNSVDGSRSTDGSSLESPSSNSSYTTEAGERSCRRSSRLARLVKVTGEWRAKLQVEEHTFHSSISKVQQHLSFGSFKIVGTT